MTNEELRSKYLAALHEWKDAEDAVDKAVKEEVASKKIAESTLKAWNHALRAEGIYAVYKATIDEAAEVYTTAKNDAMETYTFDMEKLNAE